MASISPRKNKEGKIISYQIKVARGRDKITGKQLTPYTMTYTPPTGWSKKAIERELQKVAGEFESSCNRGEVLTKAQEKEKIISEQKEYEQQPTFERYSEMYLAEKKPTWSIGTYNCYKMVFEKAIVTLGNKKLYEIDISDMKQYFSTLVSMYSHNTVARHYIICKTMFSNAVENGVIESNPMQNMKRPAPRKDEIKKEVSAYTEQQVQYIVTCLEKEPLMWKALTLFAIDSGCRRGEIIALKWEEIDFNTGHCRICRNAQYTTEEGIYITTPKNKRSRDIFLTDISLPVLREWRKEQQKLFFKLGIVNNGFCFTKNNGKMLYPQALTTRFKAFGKRYNIPDLHPHALRHTMATISIANGADVVSVSKKLGHSSPTMTLEVYSHANEEAQRRANDILMNAIRIESNKKQA